MASTIATSRGPPRPRRLCARWRQHHGGDVTTRLAEDKAVVGAEVPGTQYDRWHDGLTQASNH